MVEKAAVSTGVEPVSAAIDVQEPGELTSSRLVILDFLFTFVLATGLLPETLGDDWEGIYSSSWVRQHTLPSSTELGEFLTLLFGVLTLTGSWYGYHYSIRRKPHRTDKWQGFLRFQIDALLVLLYGALILSMHSTDVAFLLGIVIFVLYAAWDFLQAAEHPGKMAGGPPWLLSAVWSAFFVLCYLLVVGTAVPTFLMATVAIGLTLSYRILKLQQRYR